MVVKSHTDHSGLSTSLTVSFGGDIHQILTGYKGEQKQENPNALEKFLELLTLRSPSEEIKSATHTCIHKINDEDLSLTSSLRNVFFLNKSLI